MNLRSPEQIIEEMDRNAQLEDLAIGALAAILDEHAGPWKASQLKDKVLANTELPPRAVHAAYGALRADRTLVSTPGFTVSYQCSSDA